MAGSLGLVLVLVTLAPLLAVELVHGPAHLAALGGALWERAWITGA